MKKMKTKTLDWQP